MKTSPTYTEQFRKECEARHVLTMSHERRQEYYQGVKEHRKQKGVDDLIKEVKRQRKMMNQEMEM